MKKKKILVIRFSSIGDIVLTTPVVRCLKTQLPDCEIHFATKAVYKKLVESNPYIDKKHYLENDLQYLKNTLKRENFDYVIDLHNNIRSHLVKLSLGVKSRSFDKINFRKWVLVKFKKNILPPVHIVDRYLDTVSFLGIKNDGAGLDYFIPAEDEVDVSGLPVPFNAGYTGLVIGAKFNTKKLPLHKLIKICNELKEPVLLLGGPEDKSNGDLIVAETTGKVLNTCGRYNINQSASLVKQAKKIITHDTGLMHIAAAFKKPVITIWGNTVPQFGMYPYFGESEVPGFNFEIKDLPCRPCSKLGYEKCPKNHFLCMEAHDEIEISEKVKIL